VRQRRRWTMEQKKVAVKRMRDCKPTQLAKEIGIDKRELYRWRDQVNKHLGAGAEAKPEGNLKRENRQLRETLARKVMEVDFLQGALRRIEARRQGSEGPGARASTKKSVQ